MINQQIKLYLVTHPQQQSLESYQQFIAKVAAAGVTAVQLRMKNCDPQTFLTVAQQLKDTLDRFSIPLIINDSIDIAKEIDAAGVHLGQADLSPEQARSILGPHKIIGWSVETLEQVAKANQLNSLNYIAASAIFPSQTKTDCKTIWGIAGLRQVVQLSNYPVVAIGGINLANIQSIFTAGAAGAAVVSAIQDAVDPVAATQALVKKIKESCA